MKKVLTLLAGVSFLLSFALCANALADDLPSRAGTFTISPLIGGYLFDGEQHLKHSGVYNLNLGYNFTENLGIEVGAGFINTGFRANAGGGRVAGSLYHMDMLYHVTNLMPNLEPYAEVGGGAVLLDPEHADLRANAMVNFGGGIEYFLMPEIALRADVRDLVTFNNHYGDNTENNLMYTAGITVYFGGKKQEAVAEAAPPPPVEEVKPTPAPPPPAPKKQEAVCIQLKVEFDFDKDIVKPEYRDDIKRVADFLQANPSFKGTIEGGTDAVGTDEYNLNLSLRRAESVKKYLVDNFGIDANRLETVGFGKSEPVATNLTEEGRQENRRAVRVYCSSGEDVPPPMKAQKCIVLKVEFAVGSSEVDSKYNDNFKEMADYMKEHPAYVGTIEGYADATGSDKLNMELSVKRAESVKKYLVDNYGIPADRLNTKGIGSRRPVNSNETPEGRAANRYAVQIICEPE